MKSKLSGYIFIFISCIIYGLYGIYTRQIVNDFEVFNVQFFREGLTAIIILVLTLLGFSKWGKIQKEDVKYLLLIGIVSTINNVCMYYVYQLLPLGIASFTTYSSIIIMSLLMGYIIFKERLDKIGVISLLSVILGLFVMFRLQTEGLNVLGILIGLTYGFMISLFVTFTKKLKGEYGPLQVYMVAAIFTSISSLIISIIIGEDFPTLEFNSAWLWIVIFAISAALANGLYILGIQQKVEMSIASIIMPMESVTLAITGYIFYSEVMGTRSILGAIIILVASITPSLVELYKRKKKTLP